MNPEGCQHSDGTKDICRYHREVTQAVRIEHLLAVVEPFCPGVAKKSGLYVVRFLRARPDTKFYRNLLPVLTTPLQVLSKFIRERGRDSRGPRSLWPRWPPPPPSRLSHISQLGKFPCNPKKRPLGKEGRKDGDCSHSLFSRFSANLPLREKLSESCATSCARR